MKKICLVLFIGWICGMTGPDLAVQMNSRKKPNDSKVDLIMTLINKKGKTRSSSLRSISKSDGEKQIIWFLSPADDKGIAFLKIEHDDRDDEMRIWLPAFKKVRRISSKKRTDNFMGSDMSYEDMSSRQLDEFKYTILRQEIYDSISCYLLETTPKKHISSGYSRHITWVDSTLLIPLKEESYDHSGKLLKKKYFTYTMIGGYYTLTEILVTNIQKNHSTQLKFENIELDTGVKNDLFHERHLKRMPK